MLLRAGMRLCDPVNHKEHFLAKQAAASAKWRYQQHMKQASAVNKLKACYALGTKKLVATGKLSQEDAAKWAEIDAELISLHSDTKELLMYGNRRLTREYVSSPEGLGRGSSD